MRINVGSKSPAKLKSILRAFKDKLGIDEVDIQGFSVQSEVREQPMSEGETLLGAKNRAYKAFNEGNAHLGLGIEGGVTEIEGKMYTFGWVVIWDGTNEGTARSASFELPKIIQDRINNGEELGPINDDVFKTNASKKTKGALGCLTNGKINRDDLYLDAIIMAYIPFINAPLFDI